MRFITCPARIIAWAHYRGFTSKSINGPFSTHPCLDDVSSKMANEPKGALDYSFYSHWLRHPTQHTHLAPLLSRSTLI